MSIIVMDLEWNQGNNYKEPQNKDLPFEIIEIGAVKLDDNYEICDSFKALVKPKVYKQMHDVTSRLLNLRIEQLNSGRPFLEVCGSFLKWCGENPLFCTWGSQDLTELQRNMLFFGMEKLSKGPLAYLDVQKLFSICYEDRRLRRNLEYGVDFLKIKKNVAFHRAYADAYYTAKILKEIAGDKKEVLNNVSYDVFNPPKNKSEEIKCQFDTYVKYISRVFPDKSKAFADREVSSSKCYLCHKNLRKKIRWFSPNSKHYYCIAYCEKHGYLKCKIRIHKYEENGIFVVKTSRFVTQEEVDKIVSKRDHAREMKKKNKEKNNEIIKKEKL